jgi:hypothetical protein
MQIINGLKYADALSPLIFNLALSMPKVNKGNQLTAVYE